MPVLKLMTRRQFLATATGGAALLLSGRRAALWADTPPQWPEELGCDSVVEVPVDGGMRWVPCATAVPPAADVTTAMVAIHSLNADKSKLPTGAKGYRDLCVRLADRWGIGDSTMVVAPLFLEEQDVARYAFDPDLLHWPRSGWGWGYGSAPREDRPGATPVSSYAVVDALLLQLAGRAMAPNLETVIVLGHSAGGQFVNRYAAANRAHQMLQAEGIAVRYGCSAPSSYLYFDGERPVPGAPEQFATPQPPPEGYNSYGYGLENLAPCPYVAAAGAEAIGEQYPLRRIAYLVGERDNAMDATMARSPAAMLQGVSRLERCINYTRHLQRHFGDALEGRQTAAIVPGAGHSGSQTFSSEVGMEALFGE